SGRLYGKSGSFRSGWDEQRSSGGLANRDGSGDVVEKVEIVEAVRIETEGIVFRQPHLLGEPVDARKQVIVERRTIEDVHADDDGDIGHEGRVEADIPAQEPGRRLEAARDND